MTDYILCTGAAGLIGSWLCRKLVELGHNVIGIDDLSGGGKMPGCLKFAYVMDLRRREEIEAVFKSFDISVVYHLAANAREGASFFQPHSVVSRNSGTFINVMSAALQYGNVRKWIYTSSIAVYGKQEPPFKEMMLKRPVDIYGLEKSRIEDMIEMLADVYKFEYVIFRPHNIFGEAYLGDPYRNVIAIWMNQILRREPMTIYGTGKQQRAFTYIGDVVEPFVKAMTVGQGVYNIGGDLPMMINDAAHSVKEAMGVGFDYPITRVGDRHNEVEIAYSDHSKLRQDFECPRLNIADTFAGIRSMAKWAKSIGPQPWRVGDELEVRDHPLVPVNWK